MGEIVLAIFLGSWLELAAFAAYKRIKSEYYDAMEKHEADGGGQMK